MLAARDSGPHDVKTIFQDILLSVSFSRFSRRPARFTEPHVELQIFNRFDWKQQKEMIHTSPQASTGRDRRVAVSAHFPFTSAAKRDGR